MSARRVKHALATEPDLTMEQIDDRLRIGKGLYDVLRELENAKLIEGHFVKNNPVYRLTKRAEYEKVRDAE